MVKNSNNHVEEKFEMMWNEGSVYTDDQMAAAMIDRWHTMDICLYSKAKATE